MKNLLLSVVLCLAISLSFSQSDTKSDLKEKAFLKKNTVKAVDFFDQEFTIRFEAKAIFMNAYSEYANSVSKATAKMKVKQGANPTMASLKNKCNNMF